MKTYDDAQGRTYDLGSVDFTSDGPFAIAVPAWAKHARIDGVFVNSVSVAFTADTTGGGVTIGTASDPDKFGDYVFGVIAATDAAEVAMLEAGKFIDLDRAGDSGVRLDQFEVDLVAPTGGTPAGTGTLGVRLSFY